MATSFIGVGYGSRTTTVTSSSNDIWGTWCSGDTATSAESTWATWATSRRNATVGWAEPTQEELEAQAERQREQEEQRLEAKRLKEVADQKALDLLMAFLEDEQLRQLESEGAFIVKTKEREYRIKKGWQGNVEELNKDGIAIASWCIHPKTKVPHQDNMLAQKFLLETNEQTFRRIANRTGLQ